MTGPTTAGQLLELAKSQLQQLERRASTPHTVSAESLTAAWPAFHQAADRLLFALRAEPTVGAGQDDTWARPPAPPQARPSGRLDGHLHRATELISAAADLLSTRDRQMLPEHQRAADACSVAQHLAGTAYLVAAAAINQPALLSMVQSAAGAAVTWQDSPPDAQHAVRTAISLADASTRPTRPGPTEPDPAGFASALDDWRRAATAAAQQPAPSRADLHASAKTAGRLLAVSQVVLRAHAADVGPAEAVAATVEKVRRGGHSCNSAAEAWTSIATGQHAISPDLLEASTALDRAITQFARDGSSWASPELVRSQAPREVALGLAGGALAAARDVGEQHAAAVTHLAQTAGLCTPATRLPFSEERLEAVLDHRWVPLTEQEAAPLVEAYQHLAAATSAASLTYIALTTSGLTTDDQRPQSSPQPGPHVQTSAPDRTQPMETTLAGQRWQQTLAAVDPRLLTDPHYPVLAAALDRVELAGVDVTASLAAAAAAPLPDSHTARTLHYNLIEVCPAASTPFTRVHDTARAASQPTPYLNQGVSAVLRAREAPNRPGPSW